MVEKVVSDRAYLGGPLGEVCAPPLSVLELVGERLELGLREANAARLGLVGQGRVGFVVEHTARAAEGFAAVFQAHRRRGDAVGLAER